MLMFVLSNCAIISQYVNVGTSYCEIIANPKINPKTLKVCFYRNRNKPSTFWGCIRRTLMPIKSKFADYSA